MTNHHCRLQNSGQNRFFFFSQATVYRCLRIHTEFPSVSVLPDFPPTPATVPVPVILPLPFTFIFIFAFGMRIRVRNDAYVPVHNMHNVNGFSSVLRHYYDYHYYGPYTTYVGDLCTIISTRVFRICVGASVCMILYKCIMVIVFDRLSDATRAGGPLRTRAMRVE